MCSVAVTHSKVWLFLVVDWEWKYGVYLLTKYVRNWLLSIWFYNSCHRLPETKRHSCLFLHWYGSKFLVVMAACTPSIHVFLGCPLFLLSCGIHSIINFGILSFGIYLTWTYHCRLFFCMMSGFPFTPIISFICSFLFLSALDFLADLLSTSIPVTYALKTFSTQKIHVRVHASIWLAAHLVAFL